MKWFLALVVALNLLVGVYGVVRQRAPLDIHAQEVNPGQLKVLPADWQGDASALRAPVASAPESVTAILAPPTSVVVASASSSSKKPVVAKPAKVAGPPKTASQPLVVAKPVHPPKPAAIPVKKPVASAAAAKVAGGAALSCASWGALDAALLARVEGGLPALRLAPGQLSRSSETATTDRTNVRYWVYYPEQANGAVAQALSEEMKNKGFDNYVVQNEGQFKGSLSLGLFSKAEIAHALVERMKAAGYDKVSINERGGNSQAVTTLHFKSLNARQAAALAALQKRLTPSIGLKHLTCAS